MGRQIKKKINQIELGQYKSRDLFKSKKNRILQSVGFHQNVYTLDGGYKNACK